MECALPASCVDIVKFLYVALCPAPDYALNRGVVDSHFHIIAVQKRVGLHKDSLCRFVGENDSSPLQVFGTHIGEPFEEPSTSFHVSSTPKDVEFHGQIRERWPAVGSNLCPVDGDAETA